MIDRYVVGGFYRVNTERGRDENLNAPGMRFKPLAFDRLQPARPHSRRTRRPTASTPTAWWRAAGPARRLVELEATAPRPVGAPAQTEPLEEAGPGAALGKGDETRLHPRSARHLKAYKDSSVAMMRAAQARGHEGLGHPCAPALAWRDGGEVSVRAAAPRASPRDDTRLVRGRAPRKRCCRSPPSMPC
jgi:hypothetical protein